MLYTFTYSVNDSPERMQRHIQLEAIKQYQQSDFMMQQLREEKEYRERTERRIHELK